MTITPDAYDNGGTLRHGLTVTIPGQRTPALYYAGCEQGDGTSTVTRVDLTAVEDPRERALCRALLTHALRLLDAGERP